MMEPTMVRCFQVNSEFSWVLVTVSEMSTLNLIEAVTWFTLMRQVSYYVKYTTALRTLPKEQIQAIVWDKNSGPQIVGFRSWLPLKLSHGILMIEIVLW